MVMDSLGSERSSNRVSPPNSCFLQNSSTTDVYSNGNKRKTQEDADSDSTSKAKRHCSFTVHDILEELATGKYGSMETEVNNLFKQKIALLEPYYTTYPKSGCRDGSANDFKGTNEKVELKNSFDGLNKESENNGVNTTNSIILIESDEDEPGDRTPHGTCQNIVFNNKFPLNVSKVKKYSPKQASAVGNTSLDVKDVKKDKDIHFSMEDGNDMTEGNEQPCQSNYHAASDMEYASSQPSTRRDSSLVGETCIEKDKGVYVGVEDDEDDQQNYNGHVDLDNIWQEMAFAIESTKDTFANPSSDEHPSEDEEECEHSFILKDDLGYVCRICGVIQKGIESIIEYQYAKRTSTRTYKYEARSAEEEEITNIPPGELWSCEHVFAPTEICPHPRHSKVMKHHQLEGFNFLVRNLVTDDPGGCILAHAPGSGKTFMIISFIQIFMAKYPTARPLIVLPRGILPTWKKEFQLWQIEDIPLLDFYSVNASSRSQQLEVLNQWVERRSILFLGYQQFSSIFRNSDTCKTASTCQKILISQPSILIMDEGHTPRNENTDQLAALERVSTPRKVVLSGTLYQNHVKEVFIILNLVRPKFLKLKACKDLKRRILSRIQSSKRGNLLKKSDSEFYEMVEESLLKDDNLQRKAQVIEDLRAMTSNFLHYYKGDSLDELPGLVDFTVFLNLSPWQKREIEGLKKLGGRFKISSDGSSIYVHPQLKVLLKKTARDDRVDPVMMDGMLDNLEIRAGVKAKFYLNLLRLCESAGEKLLVFSQYLPPMKFLERLTVKIKGWTVGKEIFMITGDSDNDVRESQMEHFNKSSESRVFFGSIRACGEGISLVGASRIIILDVHLNPSVTRQAIARAFRPGQLRKVYTYRLVAAESPEEEDHSICFKKESIPKLWFEWNGSCRPQDFEMETVDVECCGDIFLETPWLHEDVVSLYKR